jgi:ribulose kinase
MNEHGYQIDTIVACGGDLKNPLFVREHADVTGCRLVLPREPEAVLLGAAMLGAVAAERYPGLEQAMAAMNAVSRVVAPAGGDVAGYHEQVSGFSPHARRLQLAYRAITHP